MSISFLDIFKITGSTGPLVLNLVSLYLLKNKTIYFAIYILGIILNSIANYLLKGIFRQRRPSKYEYIEPFSNEKYGMPSGHSQSAFFSTIYIYLVTKNIYWGMFYLLVSLITCFQRVYYKNHTIMQVIVGSLFGAFFGYVLYDYATKKIKGESKKKPDDNAFFM